MENYLIDLLTTGVLSALVTYFISSKIHNKNIENYKTINDAIKEDFHSLS